MNGGHCWNLDRRGRVSPKAPHPAGGGQNWHGLAHVLGGTYSAVPSGMTDLVPPLGEAEKTLQTSGFERPIAGFRPVLAPELVVLPFLSVVDGRNCKQRESCFVFEQTTGLVGLAVCETPHEVRAASFLTSQGRLDPCDLV